MSSLICGRTSPPPSSSSSSPCRCASAWPSPPGSRPNSAWSPASWAASSPASCRGSSLQVSGPAAGLTVLVFEAVQRVRTARARGHRAGHRVCSSSLMGALKLGRWFRAISVSVVEGMLAGIGLVLIAGQLYSVAGMKAPASGLGKIAGLPGAGRRRRRHHRGTGLPRARRGHHRRPRAVEEAAEEGPYGTRGARRGRAGHARDAGVQPARRDRRGEGPAGLHPAAGLRDLRRTGESRRARHDRRLHADRLGRSRCSAPPPWTGCTTVRAPSTTRN